MTSFFTKLVTVLGLISYGVAARVELFEDLYFSGSYAVLNSSETCQSSPGEHPLVASISVVGCVAGFFNDNCLKSEGYQADVIIRQWTSRAELNEDIGFKSFRDCNDLEAGPQLKLDYYSDASHESSRGGNKLEFRDVCKCENFPPVNTSYQATDNYGNCFVYYSELNCRGRSNKTPENRVRTYDPLDDQEKSFMPCRLPYHCTKRLTATVIDVTPTSNILEIVGPLRKITFGKHTFINNGENDSEIRFETRRKIQESVQIELPEELNEVYYLQNDISNQKAVPFDIAALEDPQTNDTKIPPTFLLEIYSHTSKE